MKYAKIVSVFLSSACLGLLTISASQGAAKKSGSPIEVSTMEELVKAIGPNRTLLLKPGVYQLTEKKLPETPYVRWKHNQTLTLRNVSHLRLIGSGLKRTQFGNAECDLPIVDFEGVNALRFEGIGFGHYSAEHGYPLDCETGLRGRESDAALREKEFLARAQADAQQQKINDWQAMAERIVKRHIDGVELPEYTTPIYPALLEQVKSQTRMMLPEWDGLTQRSHSIRPRIGFDYEIKSDGIYHKKQKAQVAAVVFDRSHNLVAALDANAQVIVAFEARNNTRFSWDKSPEWLMSKSIVPESNAPAPNGVYAMGATLKDNPRDGRSRFGSYKLLTRGGTIYKRQILFHSRDNMLDKEIPWHQDINDKEIRTLGCFLMQDPDLRRMAQLLSQTKKSIALVVQGRYDKNIVSPTL